MHGRVSGVAGIGVICLAAALAIGCSSSEWEGAAKITATSRTNECTHYVGDNLSWNQFVDEYQVQDLAWKSKALGESPSSAHTVEQYNAIAMSELDIVQEKSGESVRSIFDSAPEGSMSKLTLQYCERLDTSNENKMMSDDLRDIIKRTEEKASISPAVSLRDALWFCALAAESKETGKTMKIDSSKYSLVCPQYV